MDAARQKDGEGDHHRPVSSDTKRAEILANGYCFLLLCFWVYCSEKCRALPHKNNNDFCSDFNLGILQLVLFGWLMR